MTVIKSQNLFDPITQTIRPALITIKGTDITGVDTPDDSPVDFDLSDYLILPGFVNAHCHLELTALGPLPYPGSFVKWIQKLLGAKQHLTPEEMKDGTRQGVRKLLNSGVTTVGDHVSIDGDWKTIIHSPLRGKLFGEILGIEAVKATQAYESFKKIKKEFSIHHSLFTIHLSPHSIHALHPDTLKDVMEKESGPLSCHIAESEAEDDYFKKNSGEMADFMKSRSIIPLHKVQSGLDHVIKDELPLDKILVIHRNYLNDAEISQIQKNKMSIVYCPGSHNYFGHKTFPLEEMMDKGINIAVGTDSITSNQSLDFLHELKLIRQTYPQLKTETILTLATFNGAKALQMEKTIGSIEAGKKADIIGFKLSTTGPIETVFKADKADFIMIDGDVISS